MAAVIRKTAALVLAVPALTWMSYGADASSVDETSFAAPAHVEWRDVVLQSATLDPTCCPTVR